MSWVDDIGGLGPSPQHHLGGKGATERLVRSARIRDGLKVLVAGCGNGDTAIAIASTCDCEVTGTDINPAAIDQARKNLERNRQKVKGAVSFDTDDLLNSGLPPAGFERVIVESVLIMLPKAESIRAIHALLVPGGVLAVNEALLLSGKKEALYRVEREFEKIGITWSLPAYEAWRELFEENGFTVLSDSGPIPFNVTRMGLESFLWSPISGSTRFVRMLFNREARTFFYNVMTAMAKARIRWGYCLWSCEKK